MRHCPSHSAIKKNTFESVLMRWMKLEPIIQSEVSQKEKHQYSILMHIYGIKKDGNDNSIYETAKETQMYRTVFCGRGRGWDDLGEWHWNMCEINRQSMFNAWDRVLGAGTLGWPWGMDGERGGRGDLDVEHMCAGGWFMLMFGKNHYSIVK